MNVRNTLVNGTYADAITTTDRGLQYGDGVFETLLVNNSTIVDWSLHSARLIRGCKVLGFHFSDIELCHQETCRLIADIANHVDRCIIKIIVTRGQGGRGYLPPNNPKPNRIISRYPLPNYPQSYYQQGIELFLCKTRLAQNPQLAGIKHLNRLEQVLARQELPENFQEGLVCDFDHFVIEGTMSNVFMVKNKTLFTPSLDLCGVEGIQRENILMLAKQQGIPFHIKNIDLEEIQQADELFLTNSIIGIWPVKKFENKQWKVGAITRQLMC
jgi:4-amino-4-deoxychorismate lyase